MLDQLEPFLVQVEGWIWGAPLLILLTAVGVFLTIRLRGLQFRYFWSSHRMAFTRSNKEAEGDISPFEALMTALAGTIGIGSITGVATAVATGGLGALFWMWIAAFLGMATKYAESVLAVKYRVVDEEGAMSGGPMYYLQRGLQSKPLAISFAFLGAITAFGTGNMVQANSVALAMKEFGDFPVWIVGGILSVLTALALFGGIKRIGKLSSVLVPIMGAFYILGGLAVIAMNLPQVPSAFKAIVVEAFCPKAVMGGSLGAAVLLAMQMGVSRGVFSSEAGLGTSCISSAAARTDSAVKQGLISMCTVFLTTCIVCTITGVVIAVSGVMGHVNAHGEQLDGSTLAMQAFAETLPWGDWFVTIALVPFAYSTILSWAYNGEKCVEFLFGISIMRFYRMLFTVGVFVGAVLSLKMVWSFANIMNAMMALPNLIGLVLLSRVAVEETRTFEKEYRASKRPLSDR